MNRLLNEVVRQQSYSYSVEERFRQRKYKGVRWVCSSCVQSRVKRQEKVIGMNNELEVPKSCCVNLQGI